MQEKLDVKYTHYKLDKQMPGIPWMYLAVAGIK